MLRTGYLSINYTKGDISTYNGVVAWITEATVEITRKIFFTNNFTEDREAASDWLAVEHGCYTVIGTDLFKDFYKEISLVNQTDKIICNTRYIGNTIPKKFTFGEIYKVLKTENLGTAIWYIVNENGEVEKRENTTHSFAIIPKVYPILEFKNESEKIDLIIKTALDKKASDISIVPHHKGSFAFIRINGQLFEYSSTFSKSKKETQQNAINIKDRCIQIISSYDETRPTVGSFAFNNQGTNISIRVSTIPTNWGEKVNLRLLP